MRQPACFYFMVSHYGNAQRDHPCRAACICSSVALSQEDVNKMLFDEWKKLPEEAKAEYEAISRKKDSFSKEAVVKGKRSVAMCRNASKFYIQLMLREVKLLDECSVGESS